MQSLKRQIRSSTLAAALAALAGCGGPSTGGGETNNCMLTFTGAISGSAKCVAAGSYADGVGAGISISASPVMATLGSTSGSVLISVSAFAPGDFTAKAYNSANVKVVVGSTLLSSLAWQVEFDGTDSHSIGTFTANISDTGSSRSAGSGKLYFAPRGSATFHMTSAGTDAPVDVSVTF